MLRLSMFALLGGALVLSTGVVGQEAKTAGQEPKKEVKKEDPVKVKGFLPMQWGKIGLTDDQKQEIYKIQAKHNTEIDKLEAKIKELKGARDKEMKSVLSADQKKKLDEILTGKDGK